MIFNLLCLVATLVMYILLVSESKKNKSNMRAIEREYRRLYNFTKEYPRRFKKFYINDLNEELERISTSNKKRIEEIKIIKKYLEEL